MKKLIFCSLLGLFLCAAAAAQPLRNSVINTDNPAKAQISFKFGYLSKSFGRLIV